MPYFLACLFILLAALPAAAQDSSCPDSTLAQTLSRFDDVYAKRRKMLVRCSVYAHNLVGNNVSMADIPIFVDSNIAALLTDGDTANGELYGASVDYGTTLRLTLEVPDCASYKGLLSMPDYRSGRSFFFADIHATPEQIDALCNADQAWCTDCD